MHCEAASERLPWLLNGSLDKGEAEEVRGHLAGCPRCRGDLEETRQAAAVFGAHPPTAVLLDLAWDRAADGLDPAVVSHHLDECTDCQEELALARESRLELEAGGEPRRRRRTVWPLFALPATLAAGLVFGLWWSPRQRAGTPPDGREQEGMRVSALEREVSRLRGMMASLDSAAQAPAPRVNLPLFEIFPGRAVRGGAEGGNEVVIPDGATEVALLLGAEAPSGGPAELAIHGSDGREVWRGGGLLYRPPGGYVVTVPVALIPDGGYVLTVRPQRGSAMVFKLRVRRAG